MPNPIGNFLFHVLRSSLILLGFVNGVIYGQGCWSCPEYPPTDIPLDDRAFEIPWGYNIPQQVHITQGDYDGKAVIISWVTADEPGTSEVWCRGPSFDIVFNGTFTNYTFSDYQSGYIHHVLVDGLEHGTQYYYRIFGIKQHRDLWFETPPKIDPDASYTFGIMGDLGQTYNSLATLDYYERTKGQTVLYVGDLSYADKYDHNDGIRWDTWALLVEHSAAYQPWIWTAGDHEIEYRPDLGEVVTFKPYQHRYTTPYAASNSSSPFWYAVRRASAHIIVLSSYSPFVKYTPQWHWLAGELKRVDREKTPWLIVLMHSPMYNSNEEHYMEGESMRAVFEIWFVHYKVDIVFAGHVHAYERSYRISNINYNITSGNRYPIADKSAPMYITVGGGGNQEGHAERFTEPQPDYSAFREATYGHATLQLKNRTHALYRWNRNDDRGSVEVDHVTFHNQYWASKYQRRQWKKNHDAFGIAEL